MNIRPATEADIPAIARVHVDSWRTAYHGIVADSYLSQLSYAKSAAGHRHRMAQPGNIQLVAELPHHGIVGFLSGGPERSGDSRFSGKLYAIYLLDAFHRRGLGTALVQHWALRLHQASLPSGLVWVLAQNQSAATFYERLGGKFLREQIITIGTQQLPERAYGWEDLGTLIPLPR